MNFIMAIFSRTLFSLFIVVSALSFPKESYASNDKYDFEIIIFERFGQGKAESWPLEPGQPDFSKALGHLSIASASGSASVFNKATHKLGPLAYTLKKKGALIHAHTRWRQKVKSRKSNHWFRIGNRRLKGLIRLSKGRFLHLDTDLLLKTSKGTRPYRIQLHRKMRSNELHYIDHPKIGILIKATRVRVAPSPIVVDEIPLEKEPAQPEIIIPKQPENDGSTPRALPDPT